MTGKVIGPTMPLDVRHVEPLISEILKRPQMEGRFPSLFKTTAALRRANVSTGCAKELLAKTREAYVQAIEIMNEVEEQTETAILAQAEAFVKEVVKR